MTAYLESGPFRVVTAAAGLPAGAEKRSVPRLIDLLRRITNHQRPISSRCPRAHKPESGSRAAVVRDPNANATFSPSCGYSQSAAPWPGGYVGN
jgi:hypothetical protein